MQAHAPSVHETREQVKTDRYGFFVTSERRRLDVPKEVRVYMAYSKLLHIGPYWGKSAVVTVTAEPSGISAVHEAITTSPWCGQPVKRTDT